MIILVIITTRNTLQLAMIVQLAKQENNSYNILQNATILYNITTHAIWCKILKKNLYIIPDIGIVIYLYWTNCLKFNKLHGFLIFKYYYSVYILFNTIIPVFTKKKK